MNETSRTSHALSSLGRYARQRIARSRLDSPGRGPQDPMLPVASECRTTLAVKHAEPLSLDERVVNTLAESTVGLIQTESLCRVS